MKLIPFSRYKISGHSMEPTLIEGKIVWINNWAFLFSKPKIGDIVVFEFQSKDLVKRISQVVGDGVEVTGDNKSDSLATGLIQIKKIKGKVLL